MNKHRNHQIDDLAQRVFRDAIPPTWVLNEQTKDYGKDYLVEISEDNGDLTGGSFYVQLKGQEHVDISADGSTVKFLLEKKHISYYYERVKDLPVLLVVVDINLKEGWWLFLQPELDVDQSWRKKGKVTLSIPASNSLTDTAGLRAAVEKAKRWMRVHHPESIKDAVAGHKERIARLDPRFDVDVALVAGSPRFTLLPKETVPIHIKFSESGEEMRAKVREFIDKGTAVSFKPGEVTVRGSKLFETFEETGGWLQFKVESPVTVNLVVEDFCGSETGQLGDVSGRLIGGMKELRFEGGYARSPFQITLGPIARETDGVVGLRFAINEWEGQRLVHLGYFDRINRFFQALVVSKNTRIKCEQDGNEVFTASVPLHNVPSIAPLAKYLAIVGKARRIAERFGVNPVWEYKRFDRSAQDTTEQLYGIYFEGGYSAPTPGIRATCQLAKKTFRFDLAKKLSKPVSVRMVNPCIYEFLGEKITTDKLTSQFTEMTIQFDKQSKKPKIRNGRNRIKSDQRPINGDTLPVVMKGTQKTVLSVRLATAEDEAGVAI